MSDLDKQLDEALAPLHEYPGGNAAACDYYIDKDMCDCEVANTKSAIKQLIVEARIDEIERLNNMSVGFVEFNDLRKRLDTLTQQHSDEEEIGDE